MGGTHSMYNDLRVCPSPQAGLSRALMALGQESLSEGQVSRKRSDREAHYIYEGQLGARAQVAGTSRGRGPELSLVVGALVG